MIVLHNPKSFSQGRRRLPLSLLALSRMMPGRCRITDGNVDARPVDLILGGSHVSGAQPQKLIVGMTVMPGPQLRQAIIDSAEIKRRRPDAVIVWGGYFPALHPEIALSGNLIDYIVRGQGEQSFLDLLSVLAQGGDLKSVPALSYRLEDGTVQHNPDGRLIDVNQLPEYDFSHVDVSRYVVRTHLGQRTLCYASSAGCYGKCTFCAINKNFQWRWMGERPERILKIARSFKQDFDIDALEFFDAHFFVSEPRTVAIADGMKKLGVRWWGECRIDTLLGYSDASWRAIRDSGCRMIYFGAESGSDAMLQAMDKHFTTEQVLELTRKCKQHGIIPELSFVLGNPPEPRREIEETIRFIYRLKEIYPEVEILIFLYSPVPQEGTELFELARQAGFCYPRKLEDWTMDRWVDFGTLKRPRTPWLTEGLWRRIRDFEVVLHSQYPTLTDLRIGRQTRRLLRGISWWRYHYGIFRWPYELKMIMRWIQYQSPEVEGF